MTGLSLALLDLPTHCRKAATLIRDHPGLWCRGLLHNTDTEQRCGMGWVLKVGGYTEGDDLAAITIIQRGNCAVEGPDGEGRPFAVFNDHVETTAADVADRLEAIANILDPAGNG